MFLELRVLVLIVILILFVFFFKMLQKQKLDLKYCLIWMFALVGIAIFCIFPSLMMHVSNLLAIGSAANTLFLICIAFLASICVSLTIVVSRLSSRMRKLTQNIAILELERTIKKEED